MKKIALGTTAILTVGAVTLLGFFVVPVVAFMAIAGGSSSASAACVTSTPSASSLPSLSIAPAPPIATPASSSAFNLPAPGTPLQQAASGQKPGPIPANIKNLYEGAAQKYGLLWTLLAAVGYEETRHGATEATSSAGAQGLMQFLPTTFTAYAVDGDGDGKTVITDDADSIYTAAHYLAASGATEGPAGVKKALLTYNHADWYVNDVLTWAAAYGGGEVTASSCDSGGEDGTWQSAADCGFADSVTNPRSCTEALAAAADIAKNQRCINKVRGGNWYRRCAEFVARVYGYYNNGSASAFVQYEKLKALGKVSTSRDIPPGALVFFTSSSPAGHVALYAGNSQAWSNDFIASGCIDLTPMSRMAGADGSKFLGWSAPIFPDAWPL